MSFYATICGEIHYNQDKDFKRAFSFLKNNKWVNSDGYFVDECDTIINNEDTLPNVYRNYISIPLFHYRNLVRVLDDSKIVKGATGKIVWTSTDGCFVGGILTYNNGFTEESFNLEKWGIENDWGKPPQEKDFKDSEEYIESLNDYTSQIEQDFFEEYL